MAPTPAEEQPSRSAGGRQGLTARLLLFTLAILLAGELVVWLPSISRFRFDFLREQLDKAYLATFVLQAEGRSVPSEQLLDETGTEAIILRRKEATTLVVGKTPEGIDRTVLLDEARWPFLITDAVGTLLHGEQRRIRIVGRAGSDDTTTVEVVVHEEALAHELREYSIRILWLCLFLVALLGTSLFLVHQRMLVRPIRRITDHLAAFARRPESESTTLPVSGRKDELGSLESGLATMQGEIRAALHRRGREAALGASLGKVNHDLRNVLTVATITSDQLAETKDPLAQRVMPRLIASVNQAAQICTRTLDYLRYGDISPDPSPLRLREVAEEAGELVVPLTDGKVEWRNEIPREIVCDADREQLFRAFLNLIDNAAEAIQASGRDGLISVSARRTADRVVIEVADTGPGLDEEARAMLEAPPSEGPFRFKGLGFAIVREIMATHGGSFRLVETSPVGTRLMLTLPLH